MKSSKDYTDLLHVEYENAIKSGFLAFPHGVGDSTPLNSTPFHTTFCNFLELFGFSTSRKALLAALETLIREAIESGIDPLFLMIGGSFLDLQNSSPNDIDCVILYKTSPVEKAITKQWISTIRQRSKLAGLDARLVPTDANLVVLLRSVIYFSALYGESKNDQPSRGVLLVDCSDHQMAIWP